MSSILKENRVPVRPHRRETVYAIIDGERDYQDDAEGNSDGVPLTIGEGIVVLEEILAQARTALYKRGGKIDALPFFRKIGGVAVQVMETHGAVGRAGHLPKST